MVEYVQKNGTNKEIRRPGQAEAPRKGLVNFSEPRRDYAAVTMMASPSGLSVTVSPQACANSRV